MTRATVTRINSAISDCLGRCYGAELPLATLAQYVEQLRASSSWNDHEIEEVELAVLRILHQVSNAYDDLRQATSVENSPASLRQNRL